MGKHDEGLIQHFVGVRYRVRGVGSLRTTVYSFDPSSFSELAALTMEEETAKLPFALANFASQGMQIEFTVNDIDETFVISRIVGYVKPSAAGYPL